MHLHGLAIGHAHTSSPVRHIILCIFRTHVSECVLQGDVHLVLLFLHGSGQPFEIEQRLFGPKVELLRAAGIAVVLPASPLRDGKLHFWYRIPGERMSLYEVWGCHL